MPTHTLTVPHWHPTPLNVLLHGKKWAGVARKKKDRETIAAYSLLARVPRAAGKRRVTITIVLGPRQRGGDVDAYQKSSLDALKHAGMLVDDSRHWCEIMPLKWLRAAERATVIELEDI